MKNVYRFGSVLTAFAVFALAPLAMANSGGPQPGVSGVTGERTCNQSGCHTGTDVNAGGGKVEIAFPGGLTYTPGQAQTLTVTVTDAAARVFGFQVTARLSSNVKTQAGDLASPDNRTFVHCADAAFARGEIDKPNAGCPADRPLQHIQHSSAQASGTFSIRWTPPATAQGEITIYVAGNGANGNGQQSGDRIYTASYKLTPATTGGGNRPTISSGGVIGAAAFSGKGEISSGTWVEIYGTNLATATRSWAGGDFTGSNAPTALDGVRVSVGGKPAFVAFISPGQVNVQAPADLGVGPAVVTVTNAAGTSDNFTIDVKAKTPALLAPPAFKVNNKQYLAALYADGTTFVGPTNFIAGVASRPARAGDTFVTYGIGFGSVTPAIAPGTIVGASNALPNVRVLFGQTSATVSYAGLAPNFVGLYQFNIVVPSGLTAGDVPVSVTVDGTAAQTDLVTTVQ